MRKTKGTNWPNIPIEEQRKIAGTIMALCDVKCELLQKESFDTIAKVLNELEAKNKKAKERKRLTSHD